MHQKRRLDGVRTFGHHFPKSKYFYVDMDGVGRPSDNIQTAIWMVKEYFDFGEWCRRHHPKSDSGT